MSWYTSATHTHTHTNTLWYTSAAHTHKHTHTLVYLCSPQAPILSSSLVLIISFKFFLKFFIKLLRKDCHRHIKNLPPADRPTKTIGL